MRNLCVSRGLGGQQLFSNEIILPGVSYKKTSGTNFHEAIAGIESVGARVELVHTQPGGGETPPSGIPEG